MEKQADGLLVQAGSDEDVCDIFESVYGLFIRVGFDGTERAKGASYDMGAYERERDGT